MNKKEERDFIQKETETFLKNHIITKVKPVKYKAVYRKANSMTLTACPSCGSKLTISSSGVIECSNDKMKEIYNKCLQYFNGDEKIKIQILKDDKTGTFMELYDRWTYKDAHGVRTAFECGFSNRLHNAVTSYSFYINEPWQVKRLEKALNRKLTEAELSGMVKVKWKNKKGHYIEESVQRLRYPWDLL